MEPMLANNYKNQDVNGWLMSEKIDGVRAIWTGSELQSRNGNRFHAPAWFIDQLPAGIMLDGELHAGRNAFQKSLSAIKKKKPTDADWSNIRYAVFDAPLYGGGFESRIDYCRVVLDGCQIADVIEQTECSNESEMMAFFQAMVAAGAEGIMLRKPNSAYDNGRSNDLLKVKPSHTDEAVVIGHQDGEGKHLGRLGALVCQWKNVIFNLGTGFSDDLRELPPAIGAMVTFKFNGLTDGGIPRFPAFLTVRDYE